MNQALFERIAPALTVYSENPNVDARFSPMLDLLALTGGDADRAQDFIARRDTGEVTATGVFGHAMEIEAVAQSGEMKTVRRAVMRLTGQSSRPFDVYDWR